MAIRDVEVRLTGLVDRLGDKFGYREYAVRVGDTYLNNKPEIKEKDINSFSPTQLANFANSLGNTGNPTTFFQLNVSRLEPEELVRGFNYWYLERGVEVIKCMPVSLVENDSRYVVILGILKQDV